MCGQNGKYAYAIDPIERLLEVDKDGNYSAIATLGSFNQSTETQYLFQCATSLSKAVLVFPKKWIDMGLDAIDENAIVRLCSQ